MKMRSALPRLSQQHFRLHRFDYNKQPNRADVCIPGSVRDENDGC